MPVNLALIRQKQEDQQAPDLPRQLSIISSQKEKESKLFYTSGACISPIYSGDSGRRIINLKPD